MGLTAGGRIPGLGAKPLPAGDAAPSGCCGPGKRRPAGRGGGLESYSALVCMPPPPKRPCGAACGVLPVLPNEPASDA